MSRPDLSQSELADRLGARVRVAGLPAPSSLVLAQCADYLRLLAFWNRRINLTALPLDSPVPDSTLDWLLVEPLVALPFLDERASWADLGSGGGSPAIPLKIARPESRVTLVESRERKCAFLREAARSLGLRSLNVLSARFEEIPDAWAGLDAVTIRAVRTEPSLLELVARLLKPGGRLLLFGGEVDDHRFVPAEALPLPGASGSMLRVYLK